MSRHAISVDLGGTNLRVAAITEDGRMLQKISVPVHTLANRDGIVEELCRQVKTMSAAHASAGEFAGVGVGIPGIIYARTGLLRKSPNLPGWENFPVRDAIAQKLGRNAKVIVDNDANAASLGETWLGAGREVPGLCLLTLGTGIGGGIVLDGKVWRGFLGMAGEVGHMHVSENGVACGCGRQGCLETEASATAIVRKAKEAIHAGRGAALASAAGGKEITAEMVAIAAESGDDAARAIFESAGRYLGLGLSILVNVLNLPLYVLGGGVSAAWPLFAPAMLDELRGKSYVFAEGSTQVKRAELGGDAGLYGAARLAFQGEK